MNNLKQLIEAKEIIEHIHFDDIKSLVLREKVLNDINRLIMECREENEDE